MVWRMRIRGKRGRPLFVRPLAAVADETLTAVEQVTHWPCLPEKEWLVGVMRGQGRFLRRSWPVFSPRPLLVPRDKHSIGPGLGGPNMTTASDGKLRKVLDCTPPRQGWSTRLCGRVKKTIYCFAKGEARWFDFRSWKQLGGHMIRGGGMHFWLGV